MAARWDCTVGTIQHAYRELAEQGLIVSQPGRGTRVSQRPQTQTHLPLRRANLVHRAEAFLLEALTAGYELPEVEQAVQIAMDRWRAAVQEETPPNRQTLRFAGSHDMLVSWLGAHFDEINPGWSLQLSFTGSLGGLIKLAEGRADIAGCHLWDESQDAYNRPFVQRLLPNRRVALVTLAHRRMGLILTPGNPHTIRYLDDLPRPGIRFVNRQSGSGTRVWLDAALRSNEIDPGKIQGYSEEVMTHSQVAQAVAEGRADVGIGLEASASIYNLEFILLTRERYDLVIPERVMQRPEARKLADWLGEEAAQEAIANFEGYDSGETGEIEWLGG